jgi:hypothetical protein
MPTGLWDLSADPHAAFKGFADAGVDRVVEDLVEHAVSTTNGMRIERSVSALKPCAGPEGHDVERADALVSARGLG